MTPGIPHSTVSIIFWKIAGAKVIPNGIWLYMYMYKPLCILIVSNDLDGSFTGNCRYAWERSNLEKTLPTDNMEKRSSGVGGGYSSAIMA